MGVTDEELQGFIRTLKDGGGYDLSEYSDKSLKRRLEKVFDDSKVPFNQFLNNIRGNKEYAERVLKDITVNTTELFRDPQMWQLLRHRILPKFKNNKTINIWHAGCSTGQEVYSMVILLSEMGLIDKAKIVATDINTDVLDQARKGVYKYRFNIGYLDNFDKVIRQNPFNYEEVLDIPYDKYFEINKQRDTLAIRKELTEIPFFRKHDLVNDGNFIYAKFDIIMCRNVIIYFNNSLQNKVFGLFHQNLYTGGCLVLGAHEAILGPQSSWFEKNGSFYIKK
jgi:Methylase of chemotaxis methyl-accepting proteins